MAASLFNRRIAFNFIKGTHQSRSRSTATTTAAFEKTLKSVPDRRESILTGLRLKHFRSTHLLDRAISQGLTTRGLKFIAPLVTNISLSLEDGSDNFSASDSINQDTQQRQINVLKGNIDCKIAKVKSADNSQTFDVTFGDGYKTSVTSAAISEHLSPSIEMKRAGVLPVRLWDASIASDPPIVSYENVDMKGVGEVLRHIRIRGFCFVDGTPPTPEHTEKLLETIGPIRNTHYGGFYDFTSDLSAKDTAYTSESLEPHTDNTYFTEPTGLQALHLLSHTDGSGGESSLVDGFAVANKLFEQDKTAYALLSKVPVHAHASGNDGVSIQPAQPVPVLSHHSELQHLTQVRWNNADRAGVSCSLDEMDSWYDAASQFDALLSDPLYQYWFQLTPGRVLIFDNWRVLHGRSAFTGKRRMSGGYINRDDFISKFRATNMSPEEVRATTVTG